MISLSSRPPRPAHCCHPALLRGHRRRSSGCARLARTTAGERRAPPGAIRRGSQRSSPRKADLPHPPSAQPSTAASAAGERFPGRTESVPQGISGSVSPRVGPCGSHGPRAPQTPTPSSWRPARNQPRSSRVLVAAVAEAEVVHRAGPRLNARRALPERALAIAWRFRRCPAPRGLCPGAAREPGARSAAAACRQPREWQPLSPPGSGNT